MLFLYGDARRRRIMTARAIAVDAFVESLGPGVLKVIERQAETEF
jgi:hypothetical protein